MATMWKYHARIRYKNTLDGGAYLEYIRARNEAHHDIRRARQNYEKLLAANCRKNNKAVWVYVRSRNKKREGISQLQNKDGTFTSDGREIAEILNQEYYDTFTDEDTGNMPTMNQQNFQCLLNDVEITVDKVKNRLQQLKTDKSPGIDKLHPRVLAETAEVLAKPVEILFKKSLQEGKLPRQWKDAVITPIYKKGPKHMAQNYRPVSLTCILCKILERIIAEDMITHLEKNDLKCKQQHGFAKGRSTVTNLLEALNVWSEAL